MVYGIPRRQLSFAQGLAGRNLQIDATERLDTGSNGIDERFRARRPFRKRSAQDVACPAFYC